mmetsp:Transcript_15379/g.39962  ORF Transcript_15379/g.39962 Transcript_15379/m.39962 type:complete len:423 (-) Transcript_15379:191-1459(-)|eukprot:CAMPEP_0119419414 /NCGR_PEP_ID=MMETSP1335-20130426/20753_1 /TAXON_ID=259385 /ORGANISM="Chrysoculter rhomboideus, Strain RCC1486" /LENGTH=422 /DNA_ID=CAMNT_0007444721 /DNA_START=1 /DNA_END=1269 /DNA_ORIENTATION=+
MATPASRRRLILLGSIVAVAAVVDAQQRRWAPRNAGARLAAGDARYRASQASGRNIRVPAGIFAGRAGGFEYNGSFAGIKASEVAAVMCMGDSWQTGLNVGYGEHPGVRIKGLHDYRGASFACGDGGVVPGVRIETLGTLLRHFNPKLEGLSSGSHNSFEVNPCPSHRDKCGLNAAVDGASLLTNSNAAKAAKAGERNTTLLDEVTDLRTWIEAESPHLLRRWKVLSFMPSWGDQWWSKRDIGAIRASVREVLRALRDSLPRTYVNVLGVSERVSSLDDMLKQSLWCRTGNLLWKARAFLETHTVFNSAKGADEYARQINDVLREAVRDFDDGRRFVVRFRPVMLDFAFDHRLTDHMSCFHPNERLVQSLAWGLLQNMASRSPARQLRHLPAYTAPKPDKDEQALFDAFKKSAREAQDMIFY